MKLDELKEYIKNYSVIDKAKTYGILSHEIVNHTYDGKPYSFHLHMVHEYAVKYIGLLLESETEIDTILNLLAACYVHDVIEDCRKTYNDVLKETNKEVAELTYAVTDEKGKNRTERKNDKFYRELAWVPLADYLKICDRLANAKHSSSKKHRMSDMYKSEYVHFKCKLYKEKYKPMFDELDLLLK